MNEEYRELCDSIRAATATLNGWTAELKRDRLRIETARNGRGRLERLVSGGQIERKREPRAVPAGMQDGIFSGYGAKFSEAHPTSAQLLPSDYNDIIAPGAFRRTLAEHRSRSTMPAMVLQHDLGTPIGSWRDVHEDDTGLYVEGQLATKTEDGSNTWELMRIGALDGLSIGFIVKDAALDENSRTRTILAVDLLEISPVTIPAIPTARVKDVQDNMGAA